MNRAPGVRTVAAGAWLAIVMLHAAEAHGAAPVITAPATLLGDGATRATLVVTGGDEALLVSAIDFATTAGTLGEPRAVDGRIEIELVAPHLLVETLVTVTARWHGERRRKVQTAIRVLPFVTEPGERRTGGAGDLRVPERMVLGRHASAPITGRLPPDGALPRLFVNVGRVSAAEPGDDGRWKATYQAPDTRFPQVAILAVVGAGGSELDWTAIPLHGLAKVETQAVARADVVVRLRGIEFGPVRADGRGRATIVVEAPPGADRGTAIAVEDDGQRSEAPIDLAPPSFGRLLAICPPSADRAVLLVVDPAAAPATEDAFEVLARGATAGPVERVAPGRFEAPLTLDGASVRELAVDARPAGEPLSASQCGTAVPGEPPEAVDLVLDRDVVTAGAGEIVAVTVRLRYPGGRWPIEVEPRAAAELGDVTSLLPDSDGGFTATWRVPDRHTGRRSATITVTAGDTSASARATIALRSGPAAHLSVEAAHDLLRGDGGATTQIVARAVDAWDNPVDDLRLEARASAGHVGQLVAAGDGTYRATYRSRRSHEALVDEVTLAVAGAPDVTSRIRIGLTPVRRRFAIGARLGYLTNLSKVDAPVVTADVQVRLPFFDERWALGIDVGWYSSHRNDPVMGEAVSIDLTVVPLVARLTYSVELGRADLYAGVAGGAAFANMTLASAGTGSRGETALRPIVGGLLGTGLRLGKGSAVVEGAYCHAPAGADWLRGNLAGLIVTAGYRQEL